MPVAISTPGSVPLNFYIVVHDLSFMGLLNMHLLFLFCRGLLISLLQVVLLHIYLYWSKRFANDTMVFRMFYILLNVYTCHVH